MATMNTSLYARLLEPGLAKVSTGRANAPATYTAITDAKPYTISPLKTGIRTTSVIGPGPMVRRGDEEPVQFETVLPGAFNESAYYNYALGMRISENLLEDELYGVIEKMAGKMGDSSRQTKEMGVARVFDNAFSSTSDYLVNNRTEAIIGSHASFGGGAAMLNGLTVPADISMASLKELRLLMRRQTNDRGNPDPFSTKKIRALLPPEQEDEFNYFTHEKSSHDPDTDKNAWNVLHRTDWTYIVSDYLTNASQWFLMDPDQTGIWFVTRQKLKTTMRQDPTNFGMIYTIRDRWGIHVDDWRYIYGSGNTPA